MPIVLGFNMSKDTVLAELRNLVKELNKRWQIKFPNSSIAIIFEFEGISYKISWDLDQREYNTSGANTFFIEKNSISNHKVRVLSQSSSLEKENWNGLFEILPDHIEKLYDKLVEMTTLKIPDELREALNLG